MSTETPPRPPVSWIAVLDRVLRGSFTQPEVLASGRIDVPVGALVRLSLLLGGIYGVCLGCFSLFGGASEAWMQVVASALKVPLLFLLTLIVSFPSLYVFAALQRLPLDLSNTLKLMLLAILVHLTVIASLGPVFAFFAASTTSYPFLLLLNVVVFAIGGLLGLMILKRATRDMFQPAHKMLAAEPHESIPEPAAEGIATPQPRVSPPPLRHAKPAADKARRLLGIWCVVYGVVGAQMGWLLRPFLGSPGMAFEWFRAREGNFLIAVMRTLGALFGA